MKRTGLSLALSLLAASTSAWSAETLLEVYRAAEDRDPLLKTAVDVNEAAQEAKPQARSQLLPSVNLTANVAQNWQDITARSVRDAAVLRAGNLSYMSGGYMLNVTQPVFHYDRFIQLDQADNRIKQAAVDVDAARQDLMIRVAESYFRQALASENLRFVQAQKDALRATASEAERRTQAGLLTLADLNQIKAGYELVAAQEILAGNEAENAQESLRAITSKLHPQLAPLSGDLPLVMPEPRNAEDWVNKAHNQNLRVTSAQLSADSAQLEIDRQKSGHLPTLDLYGTQSFSQNGGRIGNYDIVGGAVGVQLNVPIYQGGYVSSKTREAASLHEQSLDTVEQARRNAALETRQSFNSVVAGAARVKALESALRVNETSAKTMSVGFNAGAQSANDVLNVQNSLLRARREYESAKYDFILASLKLKRGIGTLSVDDLKSISTWFKS